MSGCPDFTGLFDTSVEVSCIRRKDISFSVLIVDHHLVLPDHNLHEK